MTITASYVPRRAFLISFAVATGLATSWLTQTPFGLLAPVSILYLCARRRNLLILNILMFGCLLASAVLSASTANGYTTWLSFFAISLALGSIVTAAADENFLSLSARSTPLLKPSLDQSDRGGSLFSLVHPGDRSAAVQAAARAFWTGVPQEMKFRMRQPDGEYRLADVTARPEQASGLQVDSLVASDCSPCAVSSASARPDAAAVGAAKIVEDLFGNGWAFDATGRWVYLPFFAQTTLGKTPDELNRSIADGDVSWKQLLHPEECETVSAKWARSLETGEPFNAEFRIRRKTGFAWARSSARAVRDGKGCITGWYGTSIDVDVQRKILSTMQDREQSLAHLVELVPAHLWRLSERGEPIFFNKRMIDYLGCDFTCVEEDGQARLEAMIRLTVHPEDAHGFLEALLHSLRTGVSISYRYRSRRADGTYRWMSSCGEPVRDSSGRILQWYGLSYDIDDLVTAKEALQRSERHMQTLVDTLPLQVCSWTPDGNLTYLNKRYLDELGVNAIDFEEFVATANALIHPDDADKVDRIATNSIRVGEPFALRYRRRCRDGGYRWLDGKFSPQRTETGTILEWYGLVIDVDEEVRAQEKLRVSEAELSRATQAASLAQLSASIAHEVAQPLASVVSSSDACQRWLRADPPNIERAEKTLERILLSANAAVDVVTRIRALFKRAVNARAVTPFADLINDTCDLLSEEIANHRVALVIDVDNDMPPLMMDNVQIQQVLINLIRNAIEAMDAVAERVLTVRARYSEGTVTTEIIDTGPGILASEKVFEPFFTTKAEGMGMGLAICKSIVESHAGRLWNEPAPSRGTVFRFSLPGGS